MHYAFTPFLQYVLLFDTGMVVLLLILYYTTRLNKNYSCWTYHDPKYAKEGGKAANAIEGEKKLNSLILN